MTKPFSIHELMARVNAFFRRRQQSEPTSYSFGPCTLDLRAHRVFRDGREVELTPKEFRLLEYLVRRAGRALTRDQILAAVWGDELFVTPRSVDRCVTTLRKKVEPDPHEPSFIQTIREVGYRFEFPADRTDA